MRLLDKDAILQEDFSDEFWEPVDYSSFRALISIYPEVDVETIDIKSEVAREIFAEIERLLDKYSTAQCFQGDVFVQRYFEYGLEDAIAELKNKYIGGERE